MFEDHRLDHPHPDIQYLIEHVQPIIARGLADTYEAQPINPVQFLGKWLKNYVEQEQIDQLKFKRQEVKSHAIQLEKEH